MMTDQEKAIDEAEERKEDREAERSWRASPCSALERVWKDKWVEKWRTADAVRREKLFKHNAHVQTSPPEPQ